jgi:hypothetical protein
MATLVITVEGRRADLEETRVLLVAVVEETAEALVGQNRVVEGLDIGWDYDEEDLT